MSSLRAVIGVAAAAVAVAGVFVWQSSNNNSSDSPKPASHKRASTPAPKKNKSAAALDAVGGHGSKKDKGPPILVKDDGRIYKPFQAAQQGHGKSRGEMEAEFYHHVTSTNHGLKPHIPAYFGVTSFDEDASDDTQYLALENLTHGMKRPCVLDLKMGTQTYDEDASAEKQAKEKKKYPPQSRIGFRIVGMKVHRAVNDTVFASERSWCMSLQPEDMTSALSEYFNDGGSDLNVQLVHGILKQLQTIKGVLSDHATWRMYGSSLLFVYDADSMQDGAQVRMIDFAHMFPIKEAGGKDDGYIHGVNFLIRTLQEIARNGASAAAEAKGVEETSGGQDSSSAQVGGHGNVASTAVGEVSKLEEDAAHFDVEVGFYNKAETTKDTLASVMPKLIRVEGSSPDTDGKRTMVLSDVCALVRGQSDNDAVVSIMDVKLGTRSFRMNCENEPKERYYQKYSTFAESLSPGRAQQVWSSVLGSAESSEGPACLTSNKLGKLDYLSFRDGTTTSLRHSFRLTAMSTHSDKVTQDESRSIETIQDFAGCLGRFVGVQKGGKRGHTAVVKALVAELDAVRKATQESELAKSHDLVGASLLLVHCNGRVGVMMIDFANCTLLGEDATGGDSNDIAQGISNMSEALSGLL